MVFVVSSLVFIILATPLLRNEPMAPPLPQLPIVEITIGVDNMTKNKTLIISTRAPLGSVVYDEMALFINEKRTLDMKNITSINYITMDESFNMNVTVHIEKQRYFYDANVTVNYTAHGSAYALIIDEFPKIPSYRNSVKKTFSELPYKHEAMEVKK